jgi:hypothetical protein
MKKTSLMALAALLTALPAAAQIPLEVIRVTAPVELRTQGLSSSIQPHNSVDEGDRVVTGRNGRASLQFAQQSMITLGENSELYIHSADPPDAGQGAVMRMQLTHGDLLLDARSTENVPPQDFRINLGSLTVRVLGGYVWATTDDSGETLCLLEGAAEITNGDTKHRLDGRNDCLGHRLDTNEVRIMTSTPEVMQALLARTAFDAPKGVAASALPQHLAMAPANRTKAMERRTLPNTRPIAIAAPAPDAAPAKAVASRKSSLATITAPSGGGWTVVVASLNDADAAEHMKRQLAGEGLDAALQASAADPTRKQVIIGNYNNRTDAQREAGKLKAQARFKSAWVSHRSGSD